MTNGGGGLTDSDFGICSNDGGLLVVVPRHSFQQQNFGGVVLGGDSFGKGTQVVFLPAKEVGGFPAIEFWWWFFGEGVR